MQSCPGSSPGAGTSRISRTQEDMNSSTNPNRHPKGAPGAGRFAAGIRSEPAVAALGKAEGVPVATREEWNAIPVGRHVLVRYTGEEGSGPGDVIFVRFEETLRWDHGPYRMSGGANWDSVWDCQEGASVLTGAEARSRLEAHRAADLARSEQSLREALEDSKRKQSAREAMPAEPPAGLRQALRRLWG